MHDTEVAIALPFLLCQHTDGITMSPYATDLELFILALVQRNCATPYDLKSQAGISVGSSAPVLERLEKAGFIKGSDPGVRDRRRFVITKSGIGALEKGWRSLLVTRPTDPDTILRITYLAWALGRENVVSEFIDASAIVESGSPRSSDPANPQPNPPNDIWSNLISKEELAQNLGLSPATLADWRSQRKGPAYVKVGRKIWYLRDRVKQWLLAQIRETNDGTSQPRREVALPLQTRRKASMPQQPAWPPQNKTRIGLWRWSSSTGRR